MKATDLLSKLDWLDANHRIWLVTPMQLRRLFPGEDATSIVKAVARHSKNGILRKVCKGLYANERARCIPADRLQALVPYLRPRELNYVSQETRLSDLGVISQIPVSWLTIMTTGKSHKQETIYGTIEFTHTARAPHRIMPHLEYPKKEHPLDQDLIPVASKKLALTDLRRAARNTDLVDLSMDGDLEDDA